MATLDISIADTEAFTKLQSLVKELAAAGNLALTEEQLSLTDVDWKATTEHTFRLKTVFPGIIMWDYLEFIPIEE